MTTETQILRWLDDGVLTATQLAMRLPVPRSHIRAALTTLEHLGIIELLRYKQAKLYRRVGRA